VGGAIECDRIGPGCGLRVLGALGLQERLLACFQRLGRSLLPDQATMVTKSKRAEMEFEEA
jgi:hypothetical protein